MKLINLLIFCVSFLCFLLSLFAGDTPVTAAGSLPFSILLCAGVHEGGHCLGCVITGNAILEVRLPLLTVTGSGISLSNRFSPVSYCRFRKGRKDWLVYLFGPVFSLALWAAFLWAYLSSRSMTLLLGSIVAFAVLAVNALPLGRNDMAMVIREILHRNEYST